MKTTGLYKPPRQPPVSCVRCESDLFSVHSWLNPLTAPFYYTDIDAGRWSCHFSTSLRGNSGKLLSTGNSGQWKVVASGKQASNHHAKVLTSACCFTQQCICVNYTFPSACDTIRCLFLERTCGPFNWHTHRTFCQVITTKIPLWMFASTYRVFIPKETIPEL